MHDITYTQVGDYLVPNLTIGDEPQTVYGKYGMLRKQYLKEHRKGTYAQLILSNQLNRHLGRWMCTPGLLFPGWYLRLLSSRV